MKMQHNRITAKFFHSAIYNQIRIILSHNYHITTEQNVSSIRSEPRILSLPSPCIMSFYHIKPPCNMCLCPRAIVPSNHNFCRRHVLYAATRTVPDSGSSRDKCAVRSDTAQHTARLRAPGPARGRFSVSNQLLLTPASQHVRVL